MSKEKPEDYELIATLWYSTRQNNELNAQEVSYKTVPENSVAYDDIGSLYTDPTDPLGFGPLGNDFTISYKGVRTPVNNPNSAITLRSLKETFFINVPSGAVEGSAVYYDNGLGTESKDSEIIFTITGGRGLFNNAAIAIITVDNTGKKFGQPFTSRVEVFRLKKI